MEKDRDIRTRVENGLGTILMWEECAPGIYYAVVESFDSAIQEEYYIAEPDNPVLSDEAKAYGSVLASNPPCFCFRYDVADSGKKIVEYEMYRYRYKRGLPMQEGDDIHAITEYGREYHPEYYGDYFPPHMTPRGVTLRHRQLMKGIFAIETDRFEKLVAVCDPLWECDFSEYAKSLALNTGSNGYHFFTEEAACLPLFEIWISYEELTQSKALNAAAMMNAIWQRYPDYAAKHNFMEQTGLNDSFGMMLKSLGFDIEPIGYPENLISLTQDFGTDYLLF